MKFIAILIFVSAAFAQPVLDSLFVIDSTSGYFSQGVPLDDGGYILSGIQGVGRDSHWRIARMNAEREIVWSRGFLSRSFFAMNDVLVANDMVLVPGEITVPIDSNTSTSAPLVVAYSLDGDSLWANGYEVPPNYTSFASACAANDGGFYILGTIGILEDNRFYYQIRLLKVTSSGAVVWERSYGGIDYDAGGAIVKLEGDSLLLTGLTVRDDVYNVVFMWTNLNGDSLDARLYPMNEAAYVSYPHHLFRRNDGWDFLWLTDFGSNDDTDEALWIRTSYTGELLFQRVLIGPRNSMQNFAPIDDDILTTGFTPFNGQNLDIDIVAGRANVAGYWYFNDPVSFPNYQAAYGFLPNENGLIEVLGRTAATDSTSASPCVFYLGNGAFSSFLYPIPAQLDFGIVELDSTATQDIGFAVTWDSSVTITDYAVPEWAAISLETPVTVLAGETLHYQVVFRPNAMTQFADTIHVLSDARNHDLGIPIRGEAPYPECHPALGLVNFFWTELGDSVRRPLGVRNSGTRPLHIEPIVEPVPFYLDSIGPFVIPADSFIALWFEFWPDSAIEYERLLILHSDDPHSPDTVRLLGRGIGGTVKAEDAPLLPTEFRVYPAYPNPFNASVSIRFDLPAMQRVELTIYDLQGRRVQDVLSDVLSAGTHTAHIDGGALASGIYFATLKTNTQRDVQKLLLVK